MLIHGLIFKIYKVLQNIFKILYMTIRIYQYITIFTLQYGEPIMANDASTRPTHLHTYCTH